MTKLIEIETPRLRLRQWQVKDKPLFAKINLDPDVMAYYPRTLDSGESNILADMFKTLIAEKGWGFWAVERKEDASFIGFVGLHEPAYDLPVTPCVEIGWRLSTKAWGKGYATEAAQAVMHVAFVEIKLSEVFSFASVTNKKSIAVMERIGMSNTQCNFEHPIIPEQHPLREHVLYKINKKQWQEQNSQQN